MYFLIEIRPLKSCTSFLAYTLHAHQRYTHGGGGYGGSTPHESEKSMITRRFRAPPPSWKKLSPPGQIPEYALDTLGMKPRGN